MIESSVTTIPMDPKRSQELFLYTTPLISEMISRVMGSSLILPINRIGETGLDSLPYFQGLQSLGIMNYQIGYDDDLNFLEYINESIAASIKAGTILVSRENVFSCLCMAVEMLEAATLLVEKRSNTKTFFLNNRNEMICKKCSHQPIKTEAVCLVTNPVSADLSRLNVLPQQYIPEVREHLDGFFNRRNLVSRQRKTVLQVELDNQIFNIDNDYVWLHYGKYLNDMGSNIDYVVASNHSVRKGAIFASLIDQDRDVNLVVTPYIKFPPKSPGFSMSSLSESYSVSELREFILVHVNWYSQNIRANFEWMNWISRSQDLFSTVEQVDQPITNILNIIRGHTLKQLIVSLNEGRVLSEDQKILHALVTGKA